MNMYESLSSPTFMLNEQIARQIFETLPEGGPLVMILDAEGNSWPCNSQEFAKLNISESFFKRICATIDDGDEPVIAQAEECTVVGAQLVTESSNCGYVVIALSQYTPESALANIGLIEMLLNQLNLIAKLIEKNNLLYEVQMRQYGASAQSKAASN